MTISSNVGENCPYCQTPIKPGVPVLICNECGMPHHAECWQENHGCTTFGCQGSPAVVQGTAALPALHPTPSGHLPCPFCGYLLGPMDVACPRCEHLRRQAPLGAPAPTPSMPALPVMRKRRLSWSWAFIACLVIVYICYYISQHIQYAREEVINTITPPAPAPAVEEPSHSRDGAELVFIPAGEFLMGSTDADTDAEADEKPQHTVYLDAYYIYKNDVTVAQYRQFCLATGREMPIAPAWGWIDDHPMVNVSWDDAKAYADWAGASLPTEAQWEKAARGTDGRIYPWGNEWEPTNCNNYVEGTGLGRTSPVGFYPAGASPYGCLDMEGNVMQWCADWYDKRYYEYSPSSNPTGPEIGATVVLRGEAWFCNFTTPFRTACRFDSPADPSQRYDFIGFRCVVR